jgi:hypothetical protein
MNPTLSLYAIAYGECTYGTNTFESTTSTCKPSSGNLAPTGFPTYGVIGLAVGLVLIAAAVMLHRSRKKASTPSY